MKKNKKNNNKVDKILKGVVTAGVAIGGASYMNDADMVYAAELGGEDKYEDNPGIQELAEASTTASESLVEEESEIAETSESAAESLSDENSELAAFFESDSISVSEEISQVESTSEVKSESVASENSELIATSESIAEKVKSEEADITAASQSAAESLSELRESEEAASLSASTSFSNEESDIEFASASAASESAAISASLEAESVSLSNSIVSLDNSLSTSMSTATSEIDSASAYASEMGSEYNSASEAYERDYTGAAGKTLERIEEILDDRQKDNWDQNWELARLVVEYSLEQSGFKDIKWGNTSEENGWGQNYWEGTFKDDDGNVYGVWVDDIPVINGELATGDYNTWAHPFGAEEDDYLQFVTKTMQLKDQNGNLINYSVVKDENGFSHVEIVSEETGEDIEYSTTVFDEKNETVKFYDEEGKALQTDAVTKYTDSNNNTVD